MRVTMYRGLMVTPPKKTPPTAAFFEKLARRAGAAIPKSYVAFWHAASGWDLPYSCVLPSSRRGRQFAFGLETLSDVSRNAADFHDVWFRHRLPELVLPIGRTGGEDDTLLLDLMPGSYGRVLAWISARPVPGRRRDALHVVAESFDAYLDSLLLFADDIADCRPSAKVDAWLKTLPAPRKWPGRAAFGDVYAVGRTAMRGCQ